MAVHVAVSYPPRGQRRERPGGLLEPEDVAVEVEVDGRSPRARRKHDSSPEKACGHGKGELA